MGATGSIGVWCTGCANVLGWFETEDAAEEAARGLRVAGALCCGRDIVVIDLDGDDVLNLARE